VAGALLAFRLDVPALFDNEGRYAEVAREMLLRRDFITPTLDFTLFLNKPPLTFWLAALVHHLTGPSEWARLVSVAWAAVTLVATCRLGALLYGELAGFVGGALLAVTLGFVLEARTLRPDMAVAATVVLTLLAWRHVVRRPEHDGARTRWLLVLYASLGIGMLAKGLVPVVLAGIPIGVVTLRERGWRGVLELRPGLGLVVLGMIVLPWHVAIALRHPGFVSDYLLNQHVMTFFDKKPQNDSTGDPLWFFWAAFAGRMMPWAVLLPLTLDEARRGLSRVAEPAARGTAYLWLWLGGLMLFFSLTPSRLEHYCVPALPAGALLAARVWQRGARGQVGPLAWRALVLVGIAVTAVGIFGIARGATLLARTYWIAQAPGLLSYAPLAGAVVAATGRADGRRRRATARRDAHRRAGPRDAAHERHRRTRRGRGRAALLLAAPGACRNVRGRAGHGDRLRIAARVPARRGARLLCGPTRGAARSSGVRPAGLSGAGHGRDVPLPRRAQPALGGRRAPRSRQQPAAPAGGSCGDRARRAARARPLR
jgi:4-amino-4-deoxy-L-arabinose transferase-like glycosyltransferase